MFKAKTTTDTLPAEAKELIFFKPIWLTNEQPKIDAYDITFYRPDDNPAAVGMPLNASWFGMISVPVTIMGTHYFLDLRTRTEFTYGMIWISPSLTTTGVGILRRCNLPWFGNRKILNKLAIELVDQHMRAIIETLLIEVDMAWRRPVNKTG